MGATSAKFFNQIWSSSNNAATTNTHDNVQFDQTVAAVGVCGSTLKAACQQS